MQVAGGVAVSGPVAELLLKWADGEQVEYVEALVRTFQERRRSESAPPLPPLQLPVIGSSRHRESAVQTD